jgi:hypothetical protein
LPNGEHWGKEAFMTEVLDQTLPQAPNEADLVAAIQRALAASPEPMTLSKIRSRLPASYRNIPTEQLAESLRRRVDANVLYEYSPYRSQQPRYWDRPPVVHLQYLVRAALEEEPLTWSQLRRKLPDYARNKAEEVLQDQVRQGLLYQHPRAGSRTGARFGLHPPDPREPLREQLPRLFEQIQRDYGFSLAQLRAAALELLHEEEWASPPATEAAPMPEPEKPVPVPAPAAPALLPAEQMAAPALIPEDVPVGLS